MLTFDPALMACMTTEHLIASLECCDLTPCEKELLKRLNAALDEVGTRKRVEEIEPHIQEALAQYPGEDFLSGISDDLYQLAENLRGTNRVTCMQILEDLDDLAKCTHNSSEYGRSELKDVLNGS